MKKVFTILVLVISLMVVNAGIISASDYSPPSGVLSPDEVDFGGKTVTIVSWDLRRAVPTDARLAEAEELFNVKIDTLVLQDAEQMIARILAGDAKYDICQQSHRVEYFKLVSANMLLPADDYLPEEFFESLPSIDRHIIEKLKYRGKRYGVALHDGIVNDSITMMAYNKDLIEKYNQPDPYELAFKGEWTYEAFEQIAAALTVDTDGDGIIDQYGMSNIGDGNALIRFAPSNGAETAVQEDGKWVFAFNRNNAINVVNAVRRWREMGIMGPGDFTTGKVGFLVRTHLGGVRHAKAAGVNFGLVPMPMGPDVDRYYYPAFEFWMTYLPINVEYPEGLIALANFLYREEDRIPFLDQMVLDWMNTQQHYEMYIAAQENWQGEGDIFEGTDMWRILRPQLDQALNGEKGAASALDEVANQAQAFLDDFFDQN